MAVAMLGPRAEASVRGDGLEGCGEYGFDPGGMVPPDIADEFELRIADRPEGRVSILVEVEAHHFGAEAASPTCDAEGPADIAKVFGMVWLVSALATAKLDFGREGSPGAQRSNQTGELWGGRARASDHASGPDGGDGF